MPVVHKIIRGAGSGKWLPFARAKLARLAAECESAHTPSRSKRFTVDEGMVNVEVAVKGGQHYITIERRPCPSVVSGLCDFVDQPGEGLDPTYEVPDPNDPAQTINVLRRFYPSPATKDADRTWRDEPRLARNDAAALQMVRLGASMFSSEMRKVVQVLQGMNVEIPYSPTYALTHGVFKAASGQRWIIEISNQGVVAWPMTMCRNPIVNAAGETVLDYTPIATPKPEDIPAATTAGTYVILAPPLALLDAYTKSAFFARSGWAFNDDGHRAANCVWNEVSPFRKAYLYEVVITEVENRPVSASLQLIEEGWMVAPGSGHGHMKYPNSFGALESFTVDLGVPVTVASRAPVFVYYDGATRQVVRFIYEPGNSTDNIYNDVFPFEPNFICLDDDDIGPIFKRGTETLVTHQWFDYPDGFPAPSVVESNNMNYSQCSGLIYLGQQRRDIGTVLFVHHLTQHTWNDIRSETMSQVLIVPSGEREGFYFASVLDRDVTRTSTKLESFPLAENEAGTKQTIETCGGGQELRIQAGAPFLFNPSCGSSGSKYTGSAVATNIFVSPSERFAPFLVRTEGGCTPIESPVFPVISVIDVTLYRTVTKEVTFEYHGTGDLTVSLPTPANPDALVRVLQGGEYQVMSALSDAFDPHRYIISRDVNRLGGAGWFSAAPAYPVLETGTVVAFVGVP